MHSRIRKTRSPDQVPQQSYFIPREVAKLCGVHLRSVWRWISKKEIACDKRKVCGKQRYLIPRQAVIERLQRGLQGSPANQKQAPQRREES